jgi:hypothetical protein
MQPNLSRSFVVLRASRRSRRSTVLIVSAPQSWAAHAYLIGPLKGGPFYSGPLELLTRPRSRMCLFRGGGRPAIGGQGSPRTRRGESRRILPSCRSYCAKRESRRRRLRVGVGRKGNQGRKTGAAFRAMPNMTGVLLAPIFRPYGRNQLIIALNAMHHVNLPTSMRC